MKKMLVMAACVCMAAAAMAGDAPKVFKVEVPASGISTNTEYLTITDGAGWREIDRVVVTKAPDAGTVTFSLAETGPEGTNVVYTEQVATSGALSASGTYAARPRLAVNTNVLERYAGRLIEVKVVQTGTGTNTWPCLIYAK